MSPLVNKIETLEAEYDYLLRQFHQLKGDIDVIVALLDGVKYTPAKELVMVNKGQELLLERIKIDGDLFVLEELIQYYRMEQKVATSSNTLH